MKVAGCIVGLLSAYSLLIIETKVVNIHSWGWNKLRIKCKVNDIEECWN